MIGKNKGRTLSPETRNKMSKSRLGKFPWNKGIKMTNKIKMSDQGKLNIKLGWIRRKEKAIVTKKKG